MKTIISRTAVGAALLAAAGAASAVTVSAYDNSVGGGVAADSGIFLTEGVSFSVLASGTWKNDPADYSYYISGPDGQVGNDYTVTDASGSYSLPVGSLVGEIGDSGVYFEIGSDYSGVATATGELKLLYWDSDYLNNSGTVNAQISVVPEPANLALIGLGLGAFALSRRRKA